MNYVRALDVIYIACSKALDIVYHNILVFILGQWSLGRWMSRTLFGWLCCCLDGHVAVWMVMLRGLYSVWRPATRGHSTGSVLGPVLFHISVIGRRGWWGHLSDLQMTPNCGGHPSIKFCVLSYNISHNFWNGCKWRIENSNVCELKMP